MCMYVHILYSECHIYKGFLNKIDKLYFIFVKYKLRCENGFENLG